MNRLLNHFASACALRVGTITALVALPTLAAVLICTPAAHAQFTENFDTTPNNTNPATFGNDTGGWLVSNPIGNSGVYQGSQSQAVNFSTVIAPGFTNLTDTMLTFDLLNARDSGAILRSDAGGANGVVLIVRPSLNDFYLIQRSNGSFVGTGVGVVSLAGLVAPGDDLRVTFSSAGNTFTGSVASLSAPNTVLQTTSFTYAPGTVPTSGRAGFYQYGLASSASRFDNVGINVATAAPEPGSIALVGVGFVGMAGMIIRRKSKAGA